MDDVSADYRLAMEFNLELNKFYDIVIVTGRDYKMEETVYEGARYIGDDQRYYKFKWWNEDKYEVIKLSKIVIDYGIFLRSDLPKINRIKK